MHSSPPEAPLIAAIDVGGTSAKTALIDRCGSITHPGRVPTGPGDPDGVLRRICDAATDLANRAGVAAIGIGLPGIVDPAAGVCRFSANLGWRDVPVGQYITERTGLPVVVGHDVRNGGLAEARIGAGAGYQSIFFIAIGTGLSGAYVRGGVVDNGYTQQAGEIGHISIDPNGPRCGCGGQGCLENVAGAKGLVRLYTERTGRQLTAAQIAAQAQAGQPEATEVWEEATIALGRVLAGVTQLIDPQVFVIGGGLSLAGDQLFAPVAAELARGMAYRKPPAVIGAKLADRAGLLGAALGACDVLMGKV